MRRATPLEFPFPSPPAPGSVTQVAPGVLWLRMPLPFQLDHINLWLLRDDEGWTIVLSHEPAHPVGRLVRDRNRFVFEPTV